MIKKKILFALLILISFLIVGCGTGNSVINTGPKITFSGDISKSSSCKGTAIGNLISYNKCNTIQKCEEGCINYCQNRVWVYQSHDINQVSTGKDIFGNSIYDYKCSCSCREAR